ncbi:MAG: ribosomal RNA small subunit methyltransferase A, partial [Candidatus Acidiferrales bacterium]
MKARRRRPPLGQHFLQDPSWRRRILEQLTPKPGDCWLEIGAGHGEFTSPLAEASRAVVAVERDAGLAAALRERLAAFPAARVLEADVLRVNIDLLARELGTRKLRVYGSLPYYITSPILRRLFDSLAVIEDIYAIVQREVAERLVA